MSGKENHLCLSDLFGDKQIQFPKGEQPERTDTSGRTAC